MVARIDSDNSKTLIEQMEILKSQQGGDSVDPILKKIDPKSGEGIKPKETPSYSRMHHRHNRS